MKKEKTERNASNTWAYGEKRKLARLVGISDSYMSDIISGRHGAPPKLAEKLEQEARKLGKLIHRVDWIYSYKSEHPLLGRKK